MTMFNADNRVLIVDPCPDACDESPFIDEMKRNEDWVGLYSFCNNIVESDLAMLNRCEGMIAYLPFGAKTFGTTHEIVHALQNQIPVVLVMPEGVDKVSHWLWGILGPNRLFDNLEEAAETLVKRIQVARGEKLNDSVHYPSRTQTSR
jgi:nucleoside 2-deoxyribosyltransferase